MKTVLAVHSRNRCSDPNIVLSVRNQTRTDKQHVLLNYIYLGEKHMLKIQQLIVRLVKDRKGQDMVEYALLAGFIAVAAGALLPGISDSISIIFSRMASVVSVAAAA